MSRPTPEVLAHRSGAPAAGAAAGSRAGAPPAAPPAGRPSAQVADTAMSGAASLVRSLEALDVDVVFGIPGGAILPAYDPLFDSPSVRPILLRHEPRAR